MTCQILINTMEASKTEQGWQGFLDIGWEDCLILYDS